MKIFPPSTIALFTICAIATLNAQDQPKFETASVKRMDRGIIHNSLGPGTVVLRGDPLKIVLMEAFQVKTYQIVGPSWLDEDCFEIVAKMPEGAATDRIPAMRFRRCWRKGSSSLPTRRIARARYMRW